MSSPAKATEPKGSDDTLFIAGLMWTGVCAVFLGVTCWRAWRAYTLYRRIGAFEHMKMRVHGLLVLFGILDMIYGISFTVNRGVEHGGYALHIAAAAVSTIAMCQIPLLWSQIMDYGGYYIYVWRAVQAAIALVICVAINYMVNLIYYGSDSGFSLTFSTPLYSTSATLVTVSMSTWLVVYGSRMYRSLSKTQAAQANLTAETRAERMRYIRRALYISIALAVCYLVRGIYIVLVLVTRHSSNNITTQFGPFLWFVIALWIPFIIPGCLMLHICTPSSVKFIKHGTNVRARFLETDAPEGQAVAVTRVLTDDSGIYEEEGDDGFVVQPWSKSFNPLGKGAIEMESSGSTSHIVRITSAFDTKPPTAYEGGEGDSWAETM